MTSSQSSKQQQQINRHGHTESIDHIFALTASARFHTNHIDQPSLCDLILRGSIAFPVTTYPPFRETNQNRFDGGYDGGSLLSLMRVLDDALHLCSDNPNYSAERPRSNPQKPLEQ